MANKIPLALERLVNSIQSGKTLLFGKVYTTFLSYPDNIINSNQKLVLIAFMQLGEASRIMDQVKGMDMQFQLSAKNIAVLTGLSATQANNAIKDLPRAVNELHRKKIFKQGEKIVFKIKDISGNDINKNNSGVAPYFYFEYTAPKDKISFGAEYVKEGKSLKQKSSNPAEPLYNKNTDLKFNEKMEYLKKLHEYFSEQELEQFASYKLLMIVKVVDYYLKSLKIKQQQHGNNAVLSLTWLKKAFTSYKIDLDPQKEKLLRATEYLADLHNEIVKAITTKNIPTSFKFLHNKPPQYNLSNINHVSKLQQLFFEKYDELTVEQQQELELLSTKLRTLLAHKFKKLGISDKSAIHGIKSAIVFRHLNLI